MGDKDMVDLGIHFVFGGFCVALGGVLSYLLDVAPGVIVGGGCALVIGLVIVCIGVIKR
jgi:ABC-type Mn2+/Zn2+ transport system permease subunit